MKESKDRALKTADWRRLWEDAGLPTKGAQQVLARLMYLAFCDLRTLAREGKHEQARALAEAFHNVPLLMFTKEFSFNAFRDSLDRYQGKYEGNLQFNYLREWEKLRANVSAA